jgi:poly-gamma-glutamate synthesis protein (capsule biosynthesis protein)
MTPRAAMRFRPSEAIAYDTTCAIARATGRWRYPANASGDLAEMQFLDKAYWLYKSRYPVRHAARGSGLEAWFARQPAVELPRGFRPHQEIELSAVGDLLPHRYLEHSADTLYREIGKEIFDVDIAMGNLEAVVVPNAEQLEIDITTGPRVGMTPAAFAVATRAGDRAFDCLATANNHSLDFEEAGVDATIGALRAAGIAFHGTNRREDDAACATVLERRGLRIGVISHTFGTNARRPPFYRPLLVNHTKLNREVHSIDFGLLDTQLRWCRGRADFVVTQLHWGMEFEYYPRPAQLQVARRVAELGADAIIGHHPHVVQPVEVYRTRRDPDRQVPIFYSLGNLTNPFSSSFMARSAIARITLASDARHTYVSGVRTIEVDQVVNERRETLTLRRAAPAF